MGFRICEVFEKFSVWQARGELVKILFLWITDLMDSVQESNEFCFFSLKSWILDRNINDNLVPKI